MNKTDFSRKLSPTQQTNLKSGFELSWFALGLRFYFRRLINPNHDACIYIQCKNEIKKIRRKLLNKSIIEELDLNPVYTKILLPYNVKSNEYCTECLLVFNDVEKIWHSLIEVTTEEYIEERKLL